MNSPPTHTSLPLPVDLFSKFNKLHFNTKCIERFNQILSFFAATLNVCTIDMLTNWLTKMGTETASELTLPGSGPCTDCVSIILRHGHIRSVLYVEFLSCRIQFKHSIMRQLI